MSSNLAQRYQDTRGFSERLCAPLAVEDFVVQSMPDASPTRWHLAHTTWFFETFVLARWISDYRPVDPHYQYLFNSYYNGVGEQFPRSQRGLLTRPTVAEVFEYRRAVDEHMTRLLATLAEADAGEVGRIVELGIHHEQQHQELLLTDIKHAFSCNPLAPVYRASAPSNTATDDEAYHQPGNWSVHDGGVVEVGHQGADFAFDNERPRHRVFLNPFEIQQYLVTVGEFLAFMKDGGYQRPDLWLALGWSTVREGQWSAPLYWVEKDGAWWHFTLSGLRPLAAEEPVCHVSYFEADAFARWSGARLPTEIEWEHAAAGKPLVGSFAESERFHPRSAADERATLANLYGEVWQWTSSPYTPYPGYVAPPGALGEYNGKFMCNQYVLRGGSCATPASHMRGTYRNFFPPEARWQFSGLRLARDAK